MRHARSIILLCTFALAAAGCASRSSNGSAETAAAIPADSPLAKVELGMTMQQVTEILGSPTNQVKYATGKAWIPYYFGDDTSRLEWSYKGMGRVVFAGGNVFGGGGGTVNRIDYDPKETGIRP